MYDTQIMPPVFPDVPRVTVPWGTYTPPYDAVLHVDVELLPSVSPPDPEPLIHTVAPSLIPGGVKCIDALFANEIDPPSDA